MKKWLSGILMLLGIFFQGSSSRPPREAPPDKVQHLQSGDEPTGSLVDEQERRQIEERLKGLGYFQ